jgi:hypothetical protein
MFALISGATVTFAEVPPEIPSSRTSQIFSPFFFGFGDDGESVFTSQGPHCLGYSVEVLRFIIDETLMPLKKFAV